jgi:methionyl-tRNA formyltransferase
MARLVFLGTPEAALPTLQAMDAAHDVALVITQPDRPKGRSKKPVPPPVKAYASENGLTVLQPESRVELSAAFSEHGPFDAGVVVAYGRILRSEILEAPRHGLVNVHFSLLPRWRGAAPVARALMAGDEMTGVTIMKLDEGLDTGPIITAQAIDIPSDDDTGELTKRLAALGASLLSEVLQPYLDGEIIPIEQSEEGATYANKIERGDRPVDVNASARAIENKVRGLSPAPAATLDIDGRTHKILAARTVDAQVEPGTWTTSDGRLLIGVGEGALELVILQPPGKTPQPGPDWVNGQQQSGGSVS